MNKLDQIAALVAELKAEAGDPPRPAEGPDAVRLGRERRILALALRKLGILDSTASSKTIAEMDDEALARIFEKTRDTAPHIWVSIQDRKDAGLPEDGNAFEAAPEALKPVSEVVAQLPAPPPGDGVKRSRAALHEAMTQYMEKHGIDPNKRRN